MLQALNDDVSLHKVDVNDICGMAHMLTTVSNIEMVMAEANHLGERFQALVSIAQVSLVKLQYWLLFVIFVITSIMIDEFVVV